MKDPADVRKPPVRSRRDGSLRGRAFAAVLALALIACSPLKPRPDLPPDGALPPAAGTAIDDALTGRENANPGASGFHLVADNMEAFALRLVSAKLAGRSLDVQTYIWHADLTGAAIAHALLAAADRGVRVRLLVDDMDARAKNAGFARGRRASERPGAPVQPVRLAQRQPVVHHRGRGQLRPHQPPDAQQELDRRQPPGARRRPQPRRRVLRRLEEVNFVDLDFAMVGPVVRDVSASFDRYWNSPLAYRSRCSIPMP
jgi:putative cardiolipin synthase